VAVSSSTGHAWPIQSPARKRVKTRDITAQIVADLIVSFSNEHGDWITNLKLQRLLYYAQAWHLALYGKPLFADTFQAWPNGPIQPDVYAAYLEFGELPIESANASWLVPDAVLSHIADVLKAYGHMPAYNLERLACSEEPWKAAREGKLPDESSTSEISHEIMKTFYRARLNDKKTRKTASGSD